jgi:hypothetical protein
MVSESCLKREKTHTHTHTHTQNTSHPLPWTDIFGPCLGLTSVSGFWIYGDTAAITFRPN